MLGLLREAAEWLEADVEDYRLYEESRLYAKDLLRRIEAALGDSVHPASDAPSS